LSIGEGDKGLNMKIGKVINIIGRKFMSKTKRVEEVFKEEPKKEMNNPVLCLQCKGEGLVKINSVDARCPACNGSGKLVLI
jgi:RecJ-like exonuclease